LTTLNSARIAAAEKKRVVMEERVKRVVVAMRRHDSQALHPEMIIWKRAKTCDFVFAPKLSYMYAL
jgi:hypothetical protein